MLDKHPNKEVPIDAKTDRKSLFGLLMILGAMALYLFLVRPLSADLGELKGEIDLKASALEKVSLQVASLKEAEEKYQLTTEVQRIESLKEVPSEMQQDEVIRDLIEISKTNAITLRSVSFGRGNSSEPGVSSLRLSASFEGGYSDLIRFLEGIEENGRLFKVDTISVQVQELGFVGVERATFSLTILTYFQNGV